MKIKVYIGFLILAIMAVVIIGIAVFMLIITSDMGRDLSMKELELKGIEEDLNFDSTYGSDNGFVVHPYQNSNSERSQAVLLGASIAYILREIKSFVMFSVVLAVLALVAYVIIAYIILNRIAKQNVKPAVKTEKHKKDASEKKHRNADNDSKKIDDYIEGHNSSPAIMYRNIDEMLTSIDSVIEKSKVKWNVSL